MNKNDEAMLWRGAAHFAEGMFIGLAEYMETAEVPEKVLNHVNYLKEEMEKEIRDVKSKIDKPQVTPFKLKSNQ